MTEKDVMVPNAGPQIDETPSIPGEVTDGYVGVIYFHGMGEQRRMEEVSRLVESIDTYLRRAWHVRKESLGYLAQPKTKAEPHRVKSRDEEQVYFTTTHHLQEPDGWKGDVRTARFYEVYWAPHMAAGRDPFGVVKWIGRQIVRPLRMFFTPWRERQRLRRATLAEISETPSDWPEGTKASDFNKLLAAYHAFGQGVQSRDEKTPDDGGKSGAELKEHGKFSSFKVYLARFYADKPDTAKRLETLAGVWRRRYVGTELFNLGAMLTVAMAGLLVAWAFVALVLELLTLGTGWLNLPADKLPSFFEPSWTNAGALAGSLALALGIGNFLGRFMGDVESWASLSETDALHERRKAVLAEGMDIMRHVLADPKCKRVIVVGHSLGTSVAHDTLLALAQRNQGYNNDGDVMRGPVALTKIRHLVTIASPIDKINYFFESYRTKFPSYTRAYESMRGDIQSAPFSRNISQPYIHWVNYWDGADVISGSLQSPTAAERMTHRVNNVHVSNENFPSPGRAHSAYFQNRTVISQLFEMIYFGKGNYDGDHVDYVDGDPKKGRNYIGQDFAPENPSGSGAIYRGLAAALIWFALATVLAYVFHWDAAKPIVAGITGACAFLIYIGWAASRGAGNKEPL